MRVEEEHHEQLTLRSMQLALLHAAHASLNLTRLDDEPQW